MCFSVNVQLEDPQASKNRSRAKENVHMCSKKNALIEFQQSLYILPPP
jgi:hypothetical protein